MREIAMLVTNKNFPLITVFGHGADVLFPQEYGWEIHKQYPGLIRRMVHTHPAGAAFLSEEDRTTLKAWTMAFAPHFIAMEVLCPNGKHLFRKMWWYQMMTLEEWLKTDRSKPREMKLMESDLSGQKNPDWVHDIIKFSEYDAHSI